jgi:2'-deoxynucleoside 5'-phosphate N-hydrolase
MQAYIAISYNKRKELQPVLDAIKEVLDQHSITPFVFADNYNFNPSQEKEMMQAAFAAIDKCEMLIAEVSDKAIGIGIEVGYAKAKNKTIVYLRAIGAEHSTTVGGTTDCTIIYNSTVDLKSRLKSFLHSRNT